MGDGTPQPPVGGVDLRARRRSRGLVAGALRASRRVEARLTYAALGGVAAGMLPALVMRQPIALLLGMLAAAACVLVAAAPLVRLPTRAAFELQVELALGARSMTAEALGTTGPTTSAGIRDWLREHGEADAPIDMLIWTGRVHAAQAAIDAEQAAIDAGTGDRRYAVWMAMHRQALRLALGQPASFEGLADAWRALGDPRATGFGLAWLTLLEAEAAVAAGRDPLPVLVAGRARLSSVHPLAHASVLVAGVLLMVVAVASLMAALVLVGLGVR